jgi:excisionase family DNA binding protein
MQDDSQYDLVALGEASRILKCSQETTRNLAEKGVLPTIRLGNGHRIFRRDDVERLARERAR